MTNFNELTSILDILDTWRDSVAKDIAKDINRRIARRLFRMKAFRDPKKYHSHLKHYLSKVLHKK